MYISPNTRQASNSMPLTEDISRKSKNDSNAKSDEPKNESKVD